MVARLNFLSPQNTLETVEADIARLDLERLLLTDALKMLLPLGLASDHWRSFTGFCQNHG